jgi:hypothetical protein
MVDGKGRLVKWDRIWSTPRSRRFDSFIAHFGNIMTKIEDNIQTKQLAKLTKMTDGLCGFNNNETPSTQDIVEIDAKLSKATNLIKDAQDTLVSATYLATAATATSAAKDVAASIESRQKDEAATALSISKDEAASVLSREQDALTSDVKDAEIRQLKKELEAATKC